MNCSRELDAVVPPFVKLKLGDIEFSGICDEEPVDAAKLGHEMEELVQKKTGWEILGQCSGSAAERDMRQLLTGESDGFDMRQSWEADEEIHTVQLM